MGRPEEGQGYQYKKAWVIGPNMSPMGTRQLSFESVRLKLVDVIKADENEVLFELNGFKYAVPAALARPAAPIKGLKKGAIVVCSFGGSYLFARVDAIDAKSVTCKLRFMEKTRNEKVAPDEVLAIDSTPFAPGTPAFVRFDNHGDAMHEAQIIATSEDTTWVHVDTQFSTPSK